MLAKSGLLEITMKTADLIRSNQQAQRELEQLKVFFTFLFGERVFFAHCTTSVHPFLLLENFLFQVEVDEFTKSVLSNPENQDMARRQERQKFIANPLAVIDQEVGEISREIYKAIIFLFQFYAPASSPKVSVIQMAPSPMRSPRPL